jgi:hypothetical protein
MDTTCDVKTRVMRCVNQHVCRCCTCLAHHGAGEVEAVHVVVVLQQVQDRLRVIVVVDVHKMYVSGWVVVVVVVCSFLYVCLCE